MKVPKFLEVTLRDGSYSINFQFTKKQTFEIYTSLDKAGFEYIEVGHGLGVGATKKRKGVAAESDVTYMEAALDAKNNSKWGMFCIPGIAEISDLELAVNHNMDFIRLGTNIENYANSKPFIDIAKKAGMTVFSNFMKSYVATPEKFLEYSKIVSDWGSDIIYVVDSAGGMMSEELVLYYDLLKNEIPNIKLGFHGHDNLGLGIANALKATDLGYDFVDMSLQGFGRSAGNTCTERYISALMLKGINTGFDPIEIMDIAEKHIQPLITKRGVDSIDTVAGLALFHSSYMPIIERFSVEYGVDPRRLIVSVCEENKADAPEELVERKAKELKDAGIKGNWKQFYSHYYGGEQE